MTKKIQKTCQACGRYLSSPEERKPFKSIVACTYCWEDICGDEEALKERIKAYKLRMKKPTKKKASKDNDSKIPDDKVTFEDQPDLEAVITKIEGHPGYLKLLEEMRQLHLKKAADYGTDEDPFSNIRASEGIGIEAWRAAYLRAKDKVKRIDQYCLKGTLENEGVEDSFMDLAAYALIALVMFREMKENG